MGKLYSFCEDHQIVFHVSKTPSTYLNALSLGFWVEAAKSGVCPGRTGYSLHNRYIKYIVPNIGRFKIDNDLARKIINYASLNKEGKEKVRKKHFGVAIKPRSRFSYKEDRAILQFIKANSKSSENFHRIWSKAEEENICPGRDAYSMMIRYRRLKRERHPSENIYQSDSDIDEPFKKKKPTDVSVTIENSGSDTSLDESAIQFLGSKRVISSCQRNRPTSPISEDNEDSPYFNVRPPVPVQKTKAVATVYSISNIVTSNSKGSDSSATTSNQSNDVTNSSATALRPPVPVQGAKAVATVSTPSNIVTSNSKGSHSSATTSNQSNDVTNSSATALRSPVPVQRAKDVATVSTPSNIVTSNSKGFHSSATALTSSPVACKIITFAKNFSCNVSPFKSSEPTTQKLDLKLPTIHLQRIDDEALKMYKLKDCNNTCGAADGNTTVASQSQHSSIIATPGSGQETCNELHETLLQSRRHEKGEPSYGTQSETSSSSLRESRLPTINDRRLRDEEDSDVTTSEEEIIDLCHTQPKVTTRTTPKKTSTTHDNSLSPKSSNKGSAEERNSLHTRHKICSPIENSSEKSIPRRSKRVEQSLASPNKVDLKANSMPLKCTPENHSTNEQEEQPPNSVAAPFNDVSNKEEDVVKRFRTRSEKQKIVCGVSVTPINSYEITQTRISPRRCNKMRKMITDSEKSQMGDQGTVSLSDANIIAERTSTLAKHVDIQKRLDNKTKTESCPGKLNRSKTRISPRRCNKMRKMITDSEKWQMGDQGTVSLSDANIIAERTSTLAKHVDIQKRLDNNTKTETCPGKLNRSKTRISPRLCEMITESEKSQMGDQGTVSLSDANIIAERTSTLSKHVDIQKRLDNNTKTETCPRKGNRSKAGPSASGKVCGSDSETSEWEGTDVAVFHDTHEAEDPLKTMILATMDSLATEPDCDGESQVELSEYYARACKALFDLLQAKNKRSRTNLSPD